MWLRWVAGIVWFIGLLTSEELVGHYIIATGMAGGFCYIIRWIIRNREIRRGVHRINQRLQALIRKFGRPFNTQKSRWANKSKSVGLDEEIIDLVREYRNAYELVSAAMGQARLQDADYPRVIAEVRLQRRYPEDTTTDVAVWRALNLAVELMKESAQFARDLGERHIFQHLAIAVVLHDLTNSGDRSGQIAPRLKRQVIETVHKNCSTGLLIAK